MEVFKFKEHWNKAKIEEFAMGKEVRVFWQDAIEYNKDEIESFIEKGEIPPLAKRETDGFIKFVNKTTIGVEYGDKYERKLEVIPICMIIKIIRKANVDEIVIGEPKRVKALKDSKIKIKTKFRNERHILNKKIKI